VENEYILTDEDAQRIVDYYSQQGIYPDFTVENYAGFEATPEEMKILQMPVNAPVQRKSMDPYAATVVPQSNAPVNAPIDIVPESMREKTPITPALLRRIREEEAAKVAPQAAALDPNDPYANLSKTQRRILAFSALQDAGLALQGVQGSNFQSAMSDFTERADQARKAKAAQQRSAILQNIMGGVGGSGVAGSGMSREAILQLALSGVIEPSMANVMLSEMTLAQEKSEKKQSEIYSGMEMLADIDSLMGDEGLKNIVGIEGIFTEALNSFNLGALRGDAARARSKLNKIKGGAFLKAFESLKGGGQITELEGKKAEQAQSRLETALNYPDFLDALEEFRFYVDIGIRRKNGEQIPPDQIYTPSNRTPTSQNPDVQKRLEERFGG
jgi:hypothetical protein